MEIEKMITPRFRKILELIPNCNTVADIGTDHAYIPVYLVNKGEAKKAIAMDLREGPLKRAEATVVKYNAKEKTELRLSDGLEKLLPDEADVIVIAGMGGLLINEILEKNAKKHKNALFVLQPMTAEVEVRKYLEDNGFVIVDERLAREDNKIYQVMSVRFGNMKIENEVNYHLGIKLFENNDENLEYAINKLIKKYEVILQGLKTAKNADNEKADYAKMMIEELGKIRN